MADFVAIKAAAREMQRRLMTAEHDGVLAFPLPPDADTALARAEGQVKDYDGVLNVNGDGRKVATSADDPPNAVADAPVDKYDSRAIWT